MKQTDNPRSRTSEAREASTSKDKDWVRVTLFLEEVDPKHEYPITAFV